MFFINSFYIFYIIVLLLFFSFFQGMQTRERAHCARSVFPFIKKKKKNLRDCREDPLSDGVYQHPEIRTRVGRLEV